MGGKYTRRSHRLTHRLGDTYTERQQQIIDGVIPEDQVSPQELPRLIRKAEKRGDLDIADTFTMMKARKSNRRPLSGIEHTMTLEQAMKFLEENSPFPIEWPETLLRRQQMMDDPPDLDVDIEDDDEDPDLDDF